MGSVMALASLMLLTPGIFSDLIGFIIIIPFARGPFKALALGADAVCVGRPYLWGLGAFGQDGVDKCLRILQSELENTMKFAGTQSLTDISREHVWRD